MGLIDLVEDPLNIGFKLLFCSNNKRIKAGFEITCFKTTVDWQIQLLISNLKDDYC